MSEQFAELEVGSCLVLAFLPARFMHRIPTSLKLISTFSFPLSRPIALTHLREAQHSPLRTAKQNGSNPPPPLKKSPAQPTRHNTQTSPTMGFTTGFVRPTLPPPPPLSPTNTRSQVGGIALTSTFLYLSLSLHQRNRLYQSSLLRQQAQVLTSLSDPHPQPLTPERRAPREGLAERVKDRWNAELELNVRKLQSLDWDRVREDLERGVSGLWARAFRGAREGVVEGSTSVVDAARGKSIGGAVKSGESWAEWRDRESSKPVVVDKMRAAE